MKEEARSSSEAGEKRLTVTRMGGFKDSKANPQNWENPFKRSKRSKADKTTAETTEGASGESKKSKSNKWTHKMNPKHWFG